MATDAPDSTISPGNPVPPLPGAVREWVEARVDAGVFVIVLCFLLLGTLALGACLWLETRRDPLPVYVSQGG